MLKYIIFVSSLFFFPFLWSVPIGNPAAPSILQEGFIISDKSGVNLRGEFENCYINNERLKFRKEFVNLNFSDLKIKGFSSTGTMILNIKERVDFYGKCGALRLLPEFQRNGVKYAIKTKNAPLYQGGAKIVVVEIKDLALSADAKYVFYRSKASFFTQNQAPLSKSKLRFHLQGWQLSGGIAYKISPLIPYLGVVYRDTKFHFKHTPFFEDKPLKTSQRHKGGLFLGISVGNGSYFFLNGEIHFINERSITLSGAVRF